MSESINSPRVAELLQSIFATSWTAATALGLGKTAKRAEMAEHSVDLDEVIELGLSVGYAAAGSVWSEAEELAKLLQVGIKKPISIEFKPVFAKEQD